MPPETDKSAEKMLGPGGPDPRGGSSLRASSQSKASVGSPGEEEGDFTRDGSEEEKTEERPSESGDGKRTSKEPGKSRGMGGSKSAGEGRGVSHCDQDEAPRTAFLLFGSPVPRPP